MVSSLRTRESEAQIAVFKHNLAHTTVLHNLSNANGCCLRRSANLLGKGRCVLRTDGDTDDVNLKQYGARTSSIVIIIL